ncbi:MAG: FG-GAP-like repeat-containing protein [Myxococcota bacterium]
MVVSATLLLLTVGCALQPSTAEKPPGEDTSAGVEDTGRPSDTADSGDTKDTAPPPPDADGDGSLDEEDCDDTSSHVFPGAYDWCGDGLDENCDGEDARCVDASGWEFVVLYDDTEHDDDSNYAFPTWAAHEGAIVAAPLFDVSVFEFGDAGEARGWSDADWSISMSDGGVTAVWSGCDLTGDTRTDLVATVHPSPADVSAIFQGDLSSGESIEEQAFLVTWPYTWSSHYVTGDLDGDGSCDLLLIGDEYLIVAAFGPFTEDRELSESEHTFDLYDDGHADEFLVDLDADGFQDLVVGTSGHYIEGETIFDPRSYVHWAYGPFLPGETTRAWDDSVATGERGGGTAIGDVDGDGAVDLVIGNVGKWGGTAGEDWYLDPETAGVGRVAFVSGAEAPGLDSIDEAAARIEGPKGDFGLEVSAGDVDGDGRDDVAVLGGYVLDATDTLRSEVYLFYAPFSGTVGTADADVVIRADVNEGDVTLGDFDLDGTMDLALDAPFDESWHDTEKGAIWFLWDIGHPSG